MKAFFLCPPKAFQEQVVAKSLLLYCEIQHGIKSASGKCLQGFVAIVIHIDLTVGSARSEMVGNYKGIHKVVLGQI